MSLAEYNKKRAFNRTPEPRGKKRASKKEEPLHFVVQKHDARNLHYDFRLELDGVLKSWAVPKGPSMNPLDKRLAMMTEDHPLSYADFEGEIPEGQYGAGDVIVWDRGLYVSSETIDLKESKKKLKHGFRKGHLSIILLGEKLKGTFDLVKMNDRGENAWLLIKGDDAYALKGDVTKDTQSVISGISLPRDVSTAATGVKQKKRDPMPQKINPMLARLRDTPFDRKGWLFEPKWDGYRAIAEVDHGKVKLYSRNSISFTETYTPIVHALKKLKHVCVLDGEIIALKDGRPDFHTLQQYKETPAPLQYAVFDLLYLDGHDLRAHPLIQRKRLLKNLIAETDLLFSEHIEEQGKDFFSFITNERFEGMLAKDAQSTYREGVRSDAWIKVKKFKEQEAIIVGFTKPRGGRKYLGALVLAAHEGGELRYVGHSGGGFTDTELKDLYIKLARIETKRSPLSEVVPIHSPITWVKPKYVSQVRFSEWTPEGRMRHPIYAGLRVDKSPQEVVKETSETEPKKPTTENVPVTNARKIFWPKEKYTKGDVIDYYNRISDVLLPYLKDRPQNLSRHPNGIDGKSFFQKNITAALPPYVETARIWSESNKAFRRYIVCNNKETLLYMANLGCIELNPWNSRVGSLDTPDYMILDLDPNGQPFDDLVLVAREVKKVLDLACETHYPKTSGKSGLHIVLPLSARYSYDDVRRFSELIMRIVHERVPGITSIERSPTKRKGKIYLDYLQNRFGQTLACAYSLRPYPGATVSTPLEWSEVRKGLDPGRFTIKTIWKRLEKKGDLWKPTLTKQVDLAHAISCLEKAIEK